MPFRSVFLFISLIAYPILGVVNPCFGQVEARLVSDYTTIKPNSSFEIGVLLHHSPGWHTYWKNSESGYPPKIEWILPEGWTIDAQEWPTPKIYTTEIGIDYIYSGDTLLTYRITVPEKAPLRTEIIRATASWLMCKETCQPVNNVALDLPVTVATQSTPSNDTELFKNAQIKRPENSPLWDIRAVRDQNNVLLTIAPQKTTHDPGQLYFFSEPQDIVIEQKQPQYHSKSGTILLNILSTREKGDSIKGILKATNGWNERGLQGLLVNIPVSHFESTPPLAGESNKTSGIVKILLWGFIGGLILNLMPCVFPVLGIKVMGFVSQAGEDKKKITLHALIFTSGVLISFWILVSLFISLKLAGESLGWGFQLQYPGTTYFMAAFILLFALNMSGIFEIGQSAIGVGTQLQHKSGLGGSFFSGVLATIVATPCSAPFLGTALGYAVTQPPATMFLIFTFVALGLSSPYLLLSLFPNLIKILPKPGAWMESFKQFMAFLLYATVAYLIWVLAKQVELESIYGTYGLLKILLALTLLALAAWIYGRWGNFSKPRKTKRIAIIISIMIAISALYYGYPKPNNITFNESIESRQETPQPAFTSENNVIHWEKWAPGKAEKLAQEGYTVWVDFTARWCVTCQTNKATVFSSKKVQDAFRKHKVIALKADWTNSNPEITRELAKWGKAAVPFNLIYNSQSVRQMPTILTPAIVLQALEN
jgi:thiol:disulfide interchange protein DsbD